MSANYVAALLDGIGLRYVFDRDGDIAFSMRLPGEVTRESDGSPDWGRLRYSIQPDFSILGEFISFGDYTDLAKRVVKFYLIGSDPASGVLRVQAFPKVVTSKYEHSGHIQVIPTMAESDAFNNSERTGLRATHFSNGTFGLTAAVRGALSAESLSDVISYAQESAGRFMERRFNGILVSEPVG